MIFNIKLIVSYDGTNYLGWQKTSAGPSIEQSLTQALATALRFAPKLQAASRTDAGVHASCQVVNFLMEKEPPDFGKLRHSLNNLLPKDIRILQISLEQQNFHPTLDCIGKEYRYNLCLAPTMLPHRRLYCWHRPLKYVDIAKLEIQAQQLVGEQDFAAFCNLRSERSYESTVRRIDAIEFHSCGDGEYFVLIRGNNFLYKMVRNIVGTLVYIAEGRLEAYCLPKIVASQKRSYGGITAPACGLTLVGVFY